jgi:nitrogen fixation/metabolism regulation signal transduction histidine kinase
VRQRDPVAGQLLRQISAEFSSFASSPTPRPEPTRLLELIEEVVEPYRGGLSHRIAIDVGGCRPAGRHRRPHAVRARVTNVIENALHAIPGPDASRS